ncbi:hypothetical protein [Cellulosimicrobium sp. Marseille-Q4280]|uniref:hypothetical protein n=1 Tax=Cellulosimicrobium sp. Marseille-Q4280 TaxID=2937992 RepID=UPI00203EFFFD|nr:hypothetical protein [Cellulosimicrobium sp. Marseille-Q4280]
MAKEVGRVAKKGTVSAKASARVAARSTKASAKLEGRVVKATKRSAVTGRYVAARPARTK